MGEKANTTKRVVMSPKASKKTKTVQTPRSAPSKSASAFVAAKSRPVISDNDGGQSENERRLAAAVVNAMYQAPDTFVTISTDALPADNPFSAKNLVGKEVWLITAPTSMPVHKLPFIFPAAIADGNPVVETKSGTEFCLRAEEEGAAVGMELLIPNAEGKYRPSKVPITKCFIGTESLPVVGGKNYPTKPKPIRPQPEGLKMRFMPMGATKVVEVDGGVENYLEIDNESVKPTSSFDEGQKKKRHKSSKGHGEEKSEKRKKKKHKSKDVI